MRHYPAEFLSSILSVEPCGFWPVATVTAEANRRGVPVLGPCLNRSGWRQWNLETLDAVDGSVDGSSASVRAMRCSLGFVQGVGHDVARAIVEERKAGGPFKSIGNAGRRLWFVPRDALEWLTLAGAFDGLCPSRRQVLWSLPAVHRPPSKKVKSSAGQSALPLPIAAYVPTSVPEFSDAERFQREWQALQFSPQGHPMRFYRARALDLGALCCAALQECKAGETVQVAGLCLRPHRPPTPSGQVFVFFTLEDETGLVQVTVAPNVYEDVGAALFGHAYLTVTGQVEARGVGKILRAAEIASLGV